MTHCGPWLGAGGRQPHSGRKDPGAQATGQGCVGDSMCPRSASDSRRAAGLWGLVGWVWGALLLKSWSPMPPQVRSPCWGQLVSASGPRCLACADGRTSVAVPCLPPHSPLGAQPAAPLCCPRPPTHSPAAPLLPCGTPGALPQRSPPALCFPLP